MYLNNFLRTYLTLIFSFYTYIQSVSVLRKMNDILCNFHEMQISCRRSRNQRGLRSRRHRAMRREYVASPHAKEGSEKVKRNRMILERNEGTVRRNVAISLRDWTKHLPPGIAEIEAPVPLEKEKLRVFFISPASCSPALLSPFRLFLFAQLLSVYLFQLALTNLVFSRFFPSSLASFQRFVSHRFHQSSCLFLHFPLSELRGSSFPRPLFFCFLRCSLRSIFFSLYAVCSCTP